MAASRGRSGAAEGADQKYSQESNSTCPPCPQATELSLTKIKDGGAQTRVEMSERIIEEYAEAMVAGDVFPPIIVFFDGADHYHAWQRR